MWQPRAELNTYTINSNDKKLADKIYKFSLLNTPDKVIKKFNKKSQIISYKSDKLEAGDKELEGMEFIQNSKSNLTYNDTGNIATFKKIEKIIPIAQKNLDEAKGYAIADYQEYLESNWLALLKNIYPLTINKEVFENLIKK